MEPRDEDRLILKTVYLNAEELAVLLTVILTFPLTSAVV
jgi:hypothetical protein